jgi:outer membrane receptor for ferrienterochelin and colicin
MIKLNKISIAMKNGKSSRVLSKTVYASTLACMMAMPVMAQESDAAPAVDDATEVIEVKGIRQTIQDSISIKRLSTSIVDGLSADDIGDLPALSIGEALETLTGASSHREQGGATEISIRGLGPYLGSTVFNGREAANGSGDRSVNFSQFPSELFNKIAIYKTQEASLI